MIGILDSLSGVWKPITGTRHVTSTCNLSSIICKGLESTLFLFLPLTKLPHPNNGHTYSTYSKSTDRPGKVANVSRGHQARENEYFPVNVRA